MVNITELTRYSVPCNHLMRVSDPYRWELINGEDYIPEYDEYVDVKGYYLIGLAQARYLCKYTDEIVYHNGLYDLYVWAVKE